MKKNWKRFAGVLLGLYYSLMILVAQSPTGIDTRRKDPKPFTLDDILLYIVFPVLLFIAVYISRRHQKKQAETKQTTED